MTVKELMDILSKFPDDKRVMIGEQFQKDLDVCDDIVGATDEDRDYVLIYHES
jgi:hypothetical protein